MLGSRARIAAGLIATLVWIGLVAQVAALAGRLDSLAMVAWSMLAYFTVTTNLVVAVLFTGIACGVGACSQPRLLAGVTLAILLVGVIYALLLRGLLELSGGDAIADLLLHWVSPVLVPLYWLALAPKGGLRWQDPFVWALYPLAYFVYGLIRGRLSDRYAYPFMDVGDLGGARVAVNALLIALSFVAAGCALVVLDHALSRRSRGSGPR